MSGKWTSRSATEADLKKLFGSGNLLLGWPVRQQTSDESSPPTPTSQPPPQPLDDHDPMFASPRVPNRDILPDSSDEPEHSATSPSSQEPSTARPDAFDLAK
jgi:hypothetical protein